uniref:Uncharacterized protein n=1 Tax=Plectus sambesii TaxID=2011161 RepID=A0A914UXJ6_9BILA
MIFLGAFVLLSLSTWNVGASPLAAAHDCPVTLSLGGASSDFAEHVGHAIHSFTVQDLQKFEPTVTKNNQVPTVNRDMAAPEATLPSAPDFKSADNDKFKTDIMRILDVVLTHMDDRMYFRKYTSTLELVAHEAHMHEHWAHIHAQYEQVNHQPPDSAFCACAMDIDNNGLMDVLRNAALLIREPKLTIGYDPSNFTQGDLRYYMLWAVAVYPLKLTPELFKKPEGYQLTGTAAWEHFKAKYAASPAEVHDAALFLHCALAEERDAATASRVNSLKQM